MPYQRDKTDIGLKRADGTTIGLMLARDKNNIPQYFVDDDEFLAQQMMTGTPGYGNLPPEKELAIRQDDWRSGFGLETYDAADPKRYYSSFGMDMRHRGMGILSNAATQATLPSLLAITDGGLELWDDANTLTNWTKTGAGTLTQEAATQHGGTYAAHLDCSGVALGYIYQDAVTWTTAFRGKQIVVTAWLKVDNAGVDTARLRITDGTDTTEVTTTSDTWVEKTVTHTFNAGAVRCRIELQCDAGEEAYFDDVTICSAGAIRAMAEFNQHLYFSNGQCLEKVDKSTGAISFIAGFPATITDIEPFTDNRLYIALGAFDNYWYMATNETLTESDSKAYYMKAVGDTMWKALLNNNIYSATDPVLDANWSGATTVAGTDWIISDLLTDGTTLVIKKEDRTFYVDSAGAVQILIGETKHLASATGSLGAAEWQGKYYITAGSNSLIEYDDGTITWRSSSKWCTDIAEFSGTPMAVAGDEEYLFAVVYPGTGSTVYILAGRTETIDNTTSWVWHPIQEAALTSCRTAIVSSAYEKRLWISAATATVLYYIPLPADYGNITSDANREFATGGYFITPYLHGNFKADDKGFIKLILTMGDTSSTVYFTAEYQLIGSTNWTEINSTAKFKTSPITEGFIPVDDVSSAKPVETMIRFKITGVTGDTDDTPILKGYDCRAILYPTRRRIIRALLRCADDITDRLGSPLESDAITIKEALEEAGVQTWPVEFYDIYGTTKNLRLLATPEFIRVTRQEVGKNPELQIRLIGQEVTLA